MHIVLEEIFEPYVSGGGSKCIRVRVKAAIAEILTEEGKMSASFKPIGEVQNSERLLSKEELNIRQKFHRDPLREARRDAILRTVADLFDREFPEEPKGCLGCGYLGALKGHLCPIRPDCGCHWDLGGEFTCEKHSK